MRVLLLLFLLAILVQAAPVTPLGRREGDLPPLGERSSSNQSTQGVFDGPVPTPYQPASSSTSPRPAETTQPSSHGYIPPALVRRTTPTALAETSSGCGAGCKAVGFGTVAALGLMGLRQRLGNYAKTHDVSPLVKSILPKSRSPAVEGVSGTPGLKFADVVHADAGA